MMSNSNAQIEFFKSKILEIDKKLEEVKIKSTADSISRNEVLKNLPKYDKNLSIIRLKFIRDSLRRANN